MNESFIRFWKLRVEFVSPLGNYKDDMDKLLFEQYKEEKYSRVLKTYYFLKPVIPRKIQIFLRKKKARSQNVSFPHWPIEDKLESLRRDVFRNWAETKKKIPFIWFWPYKRNFAVVLTHDVETTKGISNIVTICRLEKKYGFRSSWNFVPERYTINKELLERLTNEGFEVGIHGLKHDGKLFNSKKIFDERMVRIEKYAKDWGAVGFRSPSTHRNPEWMSDMPFEYDSSFPDTDPYEPQAGGCLSIFPFFIGDLVELPITLAQDHTLFEILGYKDISIWEQKINWIEEMNGMALVVVHPDYMLSDSRLKLYEEFLKLLAKKINFWNALPREVAKWWKDRDASLIRLTKDGCIEIEGPAKRMATIKCAYREDNNLTFRNS